MRIILLAVIAGVFQFSCGNEGGDAQTGSNGPEPNVKGGLKITFQFEIDKFLISFSGNNDEEIFRDALAEAKQQTHGSGEGFVDAFSKSWNLLRTLRNSQVTLAEIFYQEYENFVAITSSDSEVIEALKKRVVAEIERSEGVLRNRIVQLGPVRSAVFVYPGSGEGTIELPGIKDGKRVARLLTSSANLEFRELYRNGDDMFSRLLNIDSVFTDMEYPGLLDSIKNAVASGADPDAINDDPRLRTFFDIFHPHAELDTLLGQYYPMEAGYIGLVHKKDTAQVMDLFGLREISRKMPYQTRFVWSAKTNEEGMLQFYVLDLSRGNGGATVDGNMIERATVVNGISGSPEVNLVMNREGASRWRRMTREAAYDQDFIAIVLNDKVVSAPSVMQEIAGGQSVIQGGFNEDEAHEIANFLSAGQLTVPFKIVNLTYDEDL